MTITVKCECGREHQVEVPSAPQREFSALETAALDFYRRCPCRPSGMRRWVQVVKHLRDHHDLGLHEAKLFVEDLFRREGIPLD